MLISKLFFPVLREVSADAKLKFDHGADLIQIYSGFIYRGNNLIHELLEITSQR